MISRWLPLSFSVVLFLPGFVHAQAAPQYQSQKFLDVNKSNVAVAVNYDKMYEDIEIMRRILDRKLHRLYPVYPAPPHQTFGMVGTPAGMGGLGGMQSGMAMAGAMMPAAMPLWSLEGVYLRGHGVVYTATVSSLQSSAKAGSDASTKDRLLGSLASLNESEWESVRRQVRNEKEKPKKPEASKPATLTDVLLEALADYGHNLSQLGGNESLTLVLTMHESSSSRAVPKPGTASANATSKAATSNRVSESRQQLRDLELLGELHLKQGKSEEAIAAFQRLLEQVNNPKQAAECRRKLAQGYLMQGQDDKAREELDQAIALSKKDSEAKEKSLPAVKPVAALPVKLLMAVQKRQLDDVKQGKITFEEFRRLARVETLRFDGRPQSE